MSKLKIFGLFILSVSIIGIGVSIRNPDNVAETSPNHKDKSLRPRKYRTNEAPNRIGKSLETLIPEMKTYGKNWNLVSSHYNEEAGSWIFKVEVPVFFFVDDLEIRVQNDEQESSIVVNARSSSRKGKSDLGENRRHILQFFNSFEKSYELAAMQE